MSLHNGCNIYHPHCYCGKFGLLSRLVRSTVFVSEQKLSSQVCGGCAFNIHFPTAEAKRLYVLDALTQFFSYLFWRNMCSGLLSILTFFFCCFLLSIFRNFTFWKLGLHWTKLYISSSIVWLALCLLITSSTMRNSLAW